MRTARKRRVDVPPQRVWWLVSDPYALSRWWPRCVRVEGVDGPEFTQVLSTPKGKQVRLDFVVSADESGVRRAWSQQLAGSAFERLLKEQTYEVQVSPDGDGAQVTLALQQKLKGFSRFAPFLYKGAAKKQLDEALDGLVAAL